ncbi:hypothetical protein AVEN_92642-1 [Araneus ventricosus]|uniref:Uncharacterized protein n=1 Tax=Araneus ventricosus TaxID=182803 RepID=A0A4Y2AJX9_ARAVE|nr:hypothetical protein AVEN_92642-1 [Araneus ventricosus]
MRTIPEPATHPPNSRSIPESGRQIKRMPGSGTRWILSGIGSRTRDPPVTKASLQPSQRISAFPNDLSFCDYTLSPSKKWKSCNSKSICIVNCLSKD